MERLRLWWAWRHVWRRHPWLKCPDCERRHLFSSHRGCIPF